MFQMVEDIRYRAIQRAIEKHNERVLEFNAGSSCAIIACAQLSHGFPTTVDHEPGRSLPCGIGLAGSLGNHIGQTEYDH